MTHYVKSKNTHKRRGSKRAFTTDAIIKALLACNNNRSDAARILGCSDATIRRRIQTDNITAPLANPLMDSTLIQTAITKHEGNMRLVATELQISISSLHRKLAKHKGLRAHLSAARRKKSRMLSHQKTGIQDTPWDSSKPRHTHMFGGYTELLFSAMCLKHGYIPNKPQVEGLVYDMDVKGISGEHYQVQIKGRSDYNKQGVSNRASAICSFMDGYVLNKDNTPLTPSQYTEVDVFAYHLAPEDVWYLIPVDAMSSRSVSIKPNGDGTGKFEKYKNNWGIFK